MRIPLSWIFRVNRDAIAVAAAVSLDASPERDEAYADRIKELSDDEKNDFLKRLLQNEPLLGVALKKRLTARLGQEAIGKNVKHRTVGEIIHAIGLLKQQGRKKAEKEREAQRRETFKKTEEQESYLWQRVDSWIMEKNARSYDEAIRILQDLKSLAIFKGRYQGFYDRVVMLKENYRRLSALKNKIDQARLLQES